MKLALVFAIAVLGASAASAAEPNSVVGVWKPDKLRDTVGLTALEFTAEGHVFSLPDFSVVRWIPSPPGGPGAPHYLPRLPQELLGRYEAQNGKIVIRLGSRVSSTFELTKDGRLCVFPGPGIMPADGVVRPQAGERQCYRRLNAEQS